MNYVFDKEKLYSLNQIIGDKNSLSILSNYDSKDMSEEDKSFLQEKAIIDSDNNIIEKENFDILANPDSLVKFMLTGGASKYEHTVSYNDKKDKMVSFSEAPDYFMIDDETKIQDILNTIQNFIGKSNLKSVSFEQKFSEEEAIVIAAMLDLERRTTLRTFVDELPYTNNKYGVNMVWRTIHSSSKNIQWLVYCISEVIGKEISIGQDQVKEVLEELKEKTIVTEQYGQYQLTSSLSQLANRMVIIDNVMSVEVLGTRDNKDKTSAGFTCLQSGVHDILLFDYDGQDVLTKTVSSEVLLENIERLFNFDGF